MPALPPSSDFTGSAVTEGQFKTAISNLRTFLNDLLGSTGTVPSALSALGTLGGQTMAKTAAYTVVAADRGKLIECSTTFTLTLTAAATLGTGFSFIVANTGTGTITIDPNGAETINGASTLALDAGAWAIVVCNGTSFRATVAGSVPSGTLIGYQVFTASGTYTKATNNPSFVIVEVQGGGSGGSGSGGVHYSGSAGGYSRKRILNASLSASETVTVGAGGASAGNGGTSSFGSHCSATGGNYTTTGAGGTGSGGDLNISGGGTHTGGTSIRGAASFFGEGKGNYSQASTSAYGSGGCSTTNTTGTAGIVIVWEYA